MMFLVIRIERILYDLGNNPTSTTSITVFVLLALYILLRIRKKEYHSHWNVLIDQFAFDTSQFYALMREELASHEVRSISMIHKKHPEDSILSARRLYLRVEYGDYFFDLCAATFGKGFFVSWWCMEQKTGMRMLLSVIPIIGYISERWFFRPTFYKIDTHSMFMTLVHQVTLNVIDFITKEQGLKAIPDEARKPIMKDVFKRIS